MQRLKLKKIRMTFKEYKESVTDSFNKTAGNYGLLRLMYETATLLEKFKYFRNEKQLIKSDLGDLFFRMLSLMDEFGFDLDDKPFDIERYKAEATLLDKQFDITEDSILANFMFELGIMSNIVSDNIKYEVLELSDGDKLRIKQSIYSYLLQLLLISCKEGLDVETILAFSISKLKAKKKALNFRAE